ncbi:MAG: M23 family metallopeptidase [Bdellovibrionales bacterium]|nr:M23 family metallopeptidase [Bdellovibrionales bacterium]
MKKYSIFITDNSQAGSMRSLSLSTRQLKIALGGALVLLLLFAVGTLDYSMAVFKQAELKKLRAENGELNRHVKVISNKTEQLEIQLQRVEDFSMKLKTIARQGAGAIGPLPYRVLSDTFNNNSFSTDSVETTPPYSTDKKKSLLENNKNFENHLDQLQRHTHLLQKQIWETIGALEEVNHLLAFTPTVSPVQRGWVTSQFGYREHPILHVGFSDNPHFHRGLDIAARRGEKVMAPGNGVVLAVGYDAGMGNYIIINHGYDLKTLYAHLDQVFVKKSQTVTRGDSIATVGNTGRSTGPHLHYEVRISNKAVNPEHYMLDF